MSKTLMLRSDFQVQGDARSKREVQGDSGVFLWDELFEMEAD